MLYQGNISYYYLGYTTHITNGNISYYYLGYTTHITNAYPSVNYYYLHHGAGL